MVVRGILRLSITEDKWDKAVEEIPVVCEFSDGFQVEFPVYHLSVRMT